MHPLQVKDWFLFGEWFDIFWFHSCWMHGLSYAIKERLGYGLSQVVAEQDGNIARIYFSRGEWMTIGERYLKEVVRHPELLQKVLDDTRAAANELVAFSSILGGTDVTKFTPTEQIDWYERYHEKQHRVWSLGMIPNVLELENAFLTNYLKDWLREHGVDEAQLPLIFQILVTPEELSMAQKEEREMLALATHEVTEGELTKHWQTYHWLHFGWTGPSLTEEYFLAVYKGLYEEGKAKERLDQMLTEDSEVKRRKQELAAKFQIPAAVERLFRLLAELLFIKAHRMDALFMSYAAVQPLQQRIAKEHYLSLPQVYAVYSDWLVEMIRRGAVETHHINEIAKYSVRYFDGERDYLLVEEEGRQLTASIHAALPKVEAVDEVKGECAFPGKVTGVVKVVNRASEMDKFSAGDILVSNVTDPSLLPIMKKAAAFVTNQGGLTCHAAIVARELHVPCVIGTKIATRVFKDGDQVEVDATNGTVTKLEG